MKLGADGWREMVEAEQRPGLAGDPYHDRAWALFLRPYDLPEHRRRPMTTLAGIDLRDALAARRVPPWALNLLTITEIEEVTK